MASSELSPVHIEGVFAPDPTPGGFYSEGEVDESNFYIDPEVIDGTEAEDDEYLSVEDAAERYGYVKVQIYNLISDGSIVSEKRPVSVEKLVLMRRTVNKYFVSRQSLENYIQTRGYSKRPKIDDSQL